MEELIKEAESLYWQIDKAQWNICGSRLNNNQEEIKKSISEMETVMCNVFQFLKCIIERKDNIVDLSEVWHDITEEPKLGYWFVGQIGETAYDTFHFCYKGKRMSNWFDGCNIKRWAYIDDLLPKGGEQWNITK